VRLSLHRAAARANPARRGFPATGGTPRGCSVSDSCVPPPWVNAFAIRAARAAALQFPGNRGRTCIPLRFCECRGAAGARNRPCAADAFPYRVRGACVSRLQPEATPAARATITKHRASAAGSAADQKSMSPRPTGLRRLIASLHRCLDPKKGGIRACASMRCQMITRAPAPFANDRRDVDNP